MPICCGDAAARIDGRACAGVEVCRPMRDGVLESNFYADRMFRWLFERMGFISRRKRFGAMIACAPFARPVQQEALMAAAMDAGAGEAALVRGGRGGGHRRGTGSGRAGGRSCWWTSVRAK